MSFRRKIHCSYCYGAGHNKLGCAEYKTYIENRRARSAGSGYLPSEVERYDLAKNNKKTSIRRCSYCGQTKHNRRSCMHMKSNMEYFRKAQTEYRANYLKCVQSRGLGPGALVRVNGKRGACMVIDYSWIKISIDSRSSHTINLVQVKHACEKHVFSASPLVRNLRYDYATISEILVPSYNQIIRLASPSFLEGTLGLKGRFSTEGRYGNINDMSYAHVEERCEARNEYFVGLDTSAPYAS
jgi:hypothetical protein